MLYLAIIFGFVIGLTVMIGIMALCYYIDDRKQRKEFSKSLDLWVEQSNEIMKAYFEKEINNDN